MEVNHDCNLKDEIKISPSIKEEEDGRTEQTSLFVGDLSRDCTEDELYSLFSQYGQVIEVHIQRSKVTYNPLGYGFVKMESLETAKYCVDNLNDVLIRDRPIRVGWAKRNCKLQVTFQDTSLTLEEINTAFVTFGELYEEETVLHKLPQTDGKDDQCFEELTAIIHYKKREYAEAAKKNYNSINLRCKPLLVEWYHNTNNKYLTMKSRLQKLPISFPNIPYVSNKYIGAGGGMGLGGGSYGNTGISGGGYVDSPVVSIYVRFETTEAKINVTETNFYDAFQKFGKVTVVAIKNSLKDSATGTTNGYAFVHYDNTDSGRESAVSAVNATNGVIIEGVLYTAELSRNFRRGTMEDSYSSSGGVTTGSSNYSTSPLAAGRDGPIMMMPYTNMNGGNGGFANMNDMGPGYSSQVTPLCNPYWTPYNNNTSYNNYSNSYIDNGYSNNGISGGSGYSPFISYPYLNRSNSSESYYPYHTGIAEEAEEVVGGKDMNGRITGNAGGMLPRNSLPPLHVNPYPANDLYHQLPPPYLSQQQHSYMGSSFPAPVFPPTYNNTGMYFPSSTGNYNMSSYPTPTWQQKQPYYSNQQPFAQQPTIYPEISQQLPVEHTPLGPYRGSGFH